MCLQDGTVLHGVHYCARGEAESAVGVFDVSAVGGERVDGEGALERHKRAWALLRENFQPEHAEASGVIHHWSGELGVCEREVRERRAQLPFEAEALLLLADGGRGAVRVGV